MSSEACHGCGMQLAGAAYVVPRDALNGEPRHAYCCPVCAEGRPACPCRMMLGIARRRDAQRRIATPTATSSTVSR